MEPTVFGLLNGENVPIFYNQESRVELTNEIQNKINSRDLELVSTEVEEEVIEIITPQDTPPVPEVSELESDTVEEVEESVTETENENENKDETPKRGRRK